MASRRTRLKGIINLPVRRSAVKEDLPSSNNEPSQPVSPQVKESTLPKISKEITEQTGRGSLDDISERNVCGKKPLDVHTTDNNLRDSSKVEQNENLNASEIITLDEEDASTRKQIESLPQTKLKLPLPVRKRVKPSVSLSALTRKPKETDAEKAKVTKTISSNTSQGINLLSSEKTTIVNNQNNFSSKCLDSNKLQKDHTQSRPICETDASRSPTTYGNVQSPTRVHVNKDKLSSPTPKCVQSSDNVLPKSKFGKPGLHSVDNLSEHVTIEEELQNNLKTLPSGNQNISDSHRPTSNETTYSETDENVEQSSPYSNTASEATPPEDKGINTCYSGTSTVYEDASSEIEDIQPAKVERRPPTHRRLRKSGVGEILSIARRDFYKKFGNNTPDKKKLTMFDLIFYNPTTNPMKHINKPKFSDQNPSAEIAASKSDAISERIAEESVDDVVPIDEEVDSALPAPQVKVGPDGSLIIDEKSLVIATTGSQKRKDELANSSVVVDYGLGNTTYNSFSKKVKSKEWTKEETLKFYRALQAVGTDFLLMKSIFPNRTRGDLKQKYKKEDRLNRNLVDKILRNPLEFDLTALEQELAQEEKENKRREEQQKLNRITKLNHKMKGPVAIALVDEFSNPRNKISSIERKKEKKSGDKKTQQRISKKRKIVSDSSSGDEESQLLLDCDFDSGKNVEGSSEQNGFTLECNNNEDRESNYLLKSPQPTRYGRVPRASSLSKEATSTLQQQNDIIEISDVENSNEDGCEIIMEEDTDICVSPKRQEIPDHNIVAQPTFNISNLSNVEPGSLVILSTPGQKTLQLFMVAPKSQSSTLTHIPVAVTPEILASVNSNIDGLGSQEAPSSIDSPVANNNHNTLHPDT